MRDREREAKEREAESKRKKKAERQKKKEKTRGKKNLTRKKDRTQTDRSLGNRRSRRRKRDTGTKYSDSFLPGNFWMYDQSLLLTKRGTFAFPAVLSSAGDTGCLSACLPLPRPPHQDDHLPLPSPLKKSSPPSNCLGAMLALKPAWALTAHPAVSLPSPMSDCDTAVTALPQVPSCARLLPLCWADVDGLWILPTSAERTGSWQNGSLSCARQSRKWWRSLPGAQGWGSELSRYTRLKVSGRRGQHWWTGSKWSGPVASLQGCRPNQKAELVALIQALQMADGTSILIAGMLLPSPIYMEQYTDKKNCWHLWKFWASRRPHICQRR